MTLNEFIDDFRLYRLYFNCNLCKLNKETCHNISCSIQCLKQYMEEKRLTVVKDYQSIMTGIDLMERHIKKHALELCLAVDFNDYEKYHQNYCVEMACEKCKYFKDKFCYLKLFVQYLKEKSL